jgi:segregation and condensation protein A
MGVRRYLEPHLRRHSLGEVALRPLELDLDVYQGPFDLLLSLVFKEEIDLLEVPLFEVISAYLDELEAKGATADWDEMSEFLLLMSLLLEIKSRLLLPAAEPLLGTEVTPEQARDQLLARLFEYSKFKSAAARLGELAQQSGKCLLRRPEREPSRLLPALDAIAGTEDAMRLREAMMRVLENRREPDSGHIIQTKVELQRQTRIIRGILARRGKFSFNSVFGGEEPLVQALSLFALLDLLARGEIRASQPENFADIKVSLRELRKAG